MYSVHAQHASDDISSSRPCRVMLVISANWFASNFSLALLYTRDFVGFEIDLEMLRVRRIKRFTDELDRGRVSISAVTVAATAFCTIKSVVEGTLHFSGILNCGVPVDTDTDMGCPC